MCLPYLTVSSSSPPARAGPGHYVVSKAPRIQAATATGSHHQPPKTASDHLTQPDIPAGADAYSSNAPGQRAEYACRYAQEYAPVRVPPVRFRTQPEARPQDAKGT